MAGARDESGEGTAAFYAAAASAAAGSVQTTPAEGGEDPRGSEGRRVSFRAVAMTLSNRAAWGNRASTHAQPCGKRERGTSASAAAPAVPPERGQFGRAIAKVSGAAANAEREHRVKHGWVYLWFSGVGLYLWLFGLLRLHCRLALALAANRW
jgi:hypothetical protein